MIIRHSSHYNLNVNLLISSLTCTRLLLDMCLDDEGVTSELRPAPLVSVEACDHDVMTRRYNAVTSGKHLCLELDEEAHSRGYYYCRKTDGRVVKTYSSG